MKRIVGGCFFAMIAVSSSAIAQTLPESTDAGRIDPFERQMQTPQPVSPSAPTPPLPSFPATPVPEEMKDKSMLLRELHVTGMTAFSEKEMQYIYADDIGKHIQLERLWQMADEITRRYREKGYFLSRAYALAPESDGTTATIRVIEGYVGEVDFQGDEEQKRIPRLIARQITQYRPITMQFLERQLLLLNDLPGMRYRSVLEPMEGGEEGAVRLAIITEEKEKGSTSLSLDNYGSRYLGPHQLSLFHQTSIVPQQQTTLALLNSAQPERLNYVSLRHEVPIYPALNVGVQGSFVRSRPEYLLKSSHVESMSSKLSLDMRYTLVRQRDETLSVSSGLRGKDTTTDLLDLPLTRDRIRAVWFGGDYSKYTSSNAFHYANVKVSQGFEGLGSSEEGSPVISRAEAVPDFTKLEFYYQQQRF